MVETKTIPNKENEKSIAKKVDKPKEEKVKAQAKDSVKKEEKKPVEKKKVEKKNEPVKQKKVKKDDATARGNSLRISPKYAKGVCKVIKNKTPASAVKRLEDVIALRRAIPLAGREVAHQKGAGLAGAKFPINACAAIIPVVKQAEANAHAVGIENPVIERAIANQAAAPLRRGGRKAKRTHVKIVVVDKTKFKKKKK